MRVVAAALIALSPLARAAMPAHDDTCGQPPYSDPGNWNSLNGGAGLGPWIVFPGANDGVSGAFIADSNGNGGGGGPGINCGSGKAWGLYANGGAEILAWRPFTGGSLIPGQRVTIAMDNGYIDGTYPDNNVVEFQLLDGEGVMRFGFHFRGGAGDYQVFDASSATFERGTGIPFTDGGLDLAFTLDGVDTYTFRVVHLANATTTTLSGTLGGAAGHALEGLLLVHRNTGAGGAFDSYFNTIDVSCNGQPPAPSVSSDSPRCAGQDVHLSAAGAPGSAIEWAGPGGFFSTELNPVINAAGTSDAGEYSARVTLNGCTSDWASTTVDVHPEPAQPAPTNGGPVCAGGTLNLFANTTADAYLWTGPGGFSSTDRNPSIPSTTAGAAGTYNLVVYVDGCASPMGSTIATVLVPSVNWPAGLTIPCSDPVVPATTGLPVASGSCGSPAWSYADTTIHGACQNTRTITRVWTAAFDSGLVLHGTQTITVVDGTGPVLLDVPPNAVVECGAVPVAAQVTAWDACALAQRIPTNGLVLYYSFDQGGQTATDESGRGNHGVISNATFVANGFLGGARFFDGNGDFVRVPNNAQLSSPTFSVTAWAWLFDGAETRGLFGKHQSSYEDSSYLAFADPLGFHGQLNGYARVDTPLQPLLNTWTMVTLTYDGAIMRFYVDDTLRGERFAPGYIGNSLDLLIGAGEYGFAYEFGGGMPGLWWHGYIDEFRVYDRALTDHEIAQIRTSQGGGVDFSETESGTCPTFITRTWWAEDSCGNHSTSSQVLTVVDTHPPVLQNVPSDLVVPCGGDVPPPAPVIALDACAGQLPVQLVHSEEVIEHGEILIRTWTATDSCGNATTAVQRITILDETMPVLAGVPPNLTVEPGAIPPPAVVTATDDCALNEDPPPSDGLVLLFTFDADAGPQALDSSGHGHAGNIHGATFVQGGHDGGAYFFDGEDDYIRVPISPFLSVTQFTASLWAQTLDNPVTVPARGLLGKHQAGENGNSYWVYQDGTGLNAQLWATGPDGRINISPDPLYNQWAHVTVTYDGRFLRLYVNGEPAGESEIYNFGGNNLDLLIGAGEYSIGGHTPSWSWHGTIDDVRVYNRAMSPAEISELYEDTEARELSLPVAFNEVTNGVLPVVLRRTWSATDGSGNCATATQLITVVDTSIPVLSGQGADATIECPATPSFTDPQVNAPCDPNPVLLHDDTSEPGVCPALYHLTRTWVAMDSCGHTSAPVSQTITVADTTPPVLACPANVTVAQSGCSGAVFYAATATDACDTDVPVTFAPPSGSVLGPGTHTISVSAADDCGNVSTGTFTVTVLPRIHVVFAAGTIQDDNADDNIEADQDIMNLFKSGSRVPHKVRLLDCAGVDVTTSLASRVRVKLNVTQRQFVNATSSVLVNDLPESFTGVGGAGGVMVLTGGQFHYNLNTTGYAGGSASGPAFFRTHVSVDYTSTPGLVAGEEDAWLESK